MARSFLVASKQSLQGVSKAPVTAYPFTVMGWFRPGVSDASARTLFILNDQATLFKRWAIFCGVTNKILRMVCSDGTTTSTTDTTTAWVLNTWNHFTMLCTSATSRTVYLNAGGNVTTTTNITPTNIADVQMGEWSGGNYYTGRLAEIAVWNAALDINAITAGSNGAHPLWIQRQSLVTYWPIHGVQSPEQDFTGAKSLSLTNTPPSADHAPIAPYSRRGWTGWTPAIAAQNTNAFFQLGGV